MPDPEKKDDSQKQDGKASGTEDKKESLFTVPTGDGQTIQVTMKELQDLASKAAGADRKFQEAADVRKKFDNLDPDKARRGAHALELAERIAGGKASDAEAQEFLKILGLDPALLESTDEKKKSDKKESPTPKKLGFDDLDDRLKTILQENESESIRRTEQTIRDKVKNVVDADAVISKTVSIVPEKKRERFQHVLYDIAMKEVLDGVYAGKKFGPELLTLVVQGLRQKLEDMGIPTEPATLPLTQVVTGLDHLSTEVGSNEPIKRVPIGQDGYEENSIKRFAQMLIRKKRTAR
jgi:hypothetical protein